MTSESNSNTDNDTQKVSVRLPVELVDRADFVSTVRGISRRKLIEGAVMGSLTAREKDKQYREHYQAAYRRGDLSHGALVSALGEDILEEQSDDVLNDINAEFLVDKNDGDDNE